VWCADSYAFDQLELAAAYVEALAEECRALGTLREFKTACIKVCIDSEKVPEEDRILEQVRGFDREGQRKLTVAVLRTGGGIDTYPS
jgi:hypothetical protein